MPKVNPKPFQRPAISISTSDRKREWLTVHAHLLEAGDVLPNRGEVVVAKATAAGVRLEFASGSVWLTSQFNPIFAFTYPKE